MEFGYFMKRKKTIGIILDFLNLRPPPEPITKMRGLNPSLPPTAPSFFPVTHTWIWFSRNSYEVDSCPAASMVKALVSHQQDMFSIPSVCKWAGIWWPLGAIIVWMPFWLWVRAQIIMSVVSFSKKVCHCFVLLWPFGTKLGLINIDCIGLPVNLFVFCGFYLFIFACMNMSVLIQIYVENVCFF